jgi:hypothetical protein
MKKHAAARVVQRYYRWRDSTFQHAVTRVIARAKRARMLAHNKLLMFFVPMMHMALFRFRKRRAKQLAEAKRLREIERRKQEARTLNGMVMMIQRFFRFRREVYHNHLFLRRDKLLSKRFWPETSFSTASWELLAEVQGNPGAQYISPGIRQNATAFYTALQRVIIYCDSSFESVDCMMLAGVLRHKQCRAQHLILHGLDARHSNFDFDLVTAIGKCKSLRSVYLLGISVSENFVKSLFKTVQEVNPRCVEIHVESVEYTPNRRLKGHMAMSPKAKDFASELRFSRSAEGERSADSGSPTAGGSPTSPDSPTSKASLVRSPSKTMFRSPSKMLSRSPSKSFSFRDRGAQSAIQAAAPSPALRVPSLKTVYSEALCVSSGLLLSDYFNYAVPGITCVTLHKCSLRDADLELLVQGLQINTSLRKLVLSYNLVEDGGFCTIFQAILCNTQKSAMQVLDFSGNLIRCKSGMRSLLDDFHRICMKGGFLEPEPGANKLTGSRGTPAAAAANVPIAFAKQPLQVYLNSNMILEPYELPLHYITRSMLVLHGVPKHHHDKYVTELNKKEGSKMKVPLGTLLKSNKALMSSLEKRNAAGTMSLHQQTLSPAAARGVGGDKVLLSQTAPLYMGRPLLSSTQPTIGSSTQAPPGRMLPELSDFDLLHRSQSATVLQGQDGNDGGVVIG